MKTCDRPKKQLLLLMQFMICPQNNRTLQNLCDFFKNNIYLIKIDT